MGSFSFMSFAGYPVLEHKNSYDESLVGLIFQPEDYIEEQRPSSAMNKIFWGSDNDDGEDFIFKGFRQRAKVCKERIEIYGQTIRRTKQNYNAAKREVARSKLQDFPISKKTFEDYLKEIRLIIGNGVKSYELRSEYYGNFHDYLIGGDLLVENMNFNAGIHAILSVLDDNDIVEYDLTELIEGGWTDVEEVTAIRHEKIIVLTEGKTDSEFISCALKSLAPHLINYYHFIDFEGYKVEGSASALVKLVKGFAASNIRHPVVALFDNDTAGLIEMERLIKLHLPHSIKIVKLPNIKLANRYPTIGPTGSKKMNINGLACGIEMYLGEHLLRNGDKYIPIRWTDFNQTTGKYHGSIENKDIIQKKFREEMKSGKRMEMPEMAQLLNSIFTAFSN